jgi:hypothetical protein
MISMVRPQQVLNRIILIPMLYHLAQHLHVVYGLHHILIYDKLNSLLTHHKFGVRYVIIGFLDHSAVVYL